MGIKTCRIVCLAKDVEKIKKVHNKNSNGQNNVLVKTKGLFLESFALDTLLILEAKTV